MYQKLVAKVVVTGLTLGKAVLINVASGLAIAASEVLVHKINEYKDKKLKK